MRSARAHLALAVLVVGAVALACCGGHANQPTTGPSQSSGVFGIVLFPTMQQISATDTPPALPGGFGNDWGAPWSKAKVRAVAKSGTNAGKVVATVKPNVQGLFRVALAPGRYTLWLVPRAESRPTSVMVRAGAYTRVKLWVF